MNPETKKFLAEMEDLARRQMQLARRVQVERDKRKGLKQERDPKLDDVVLPHEIFR